MSNDASWGIDDAYEDAFGRRHAVSPEVRAAFMDAMQVPEGATEPPVRETIRFVRGDNRALARPATIVLEDGSERRVEGEIPLDLPHGYHTIHEDGGEPLTLVVSPRTCRLPDRTWGLAVQLYATRSRASWGMGDLADLRRLAEWSARDLGAGVLLVNPLGAAMPFDSQQPSPYFPSSRRYRSPLYLRIEEIDGAGGVGIDEGARQAMVGAEDGVRAPLIERDAIWKSKTAALARIFEATDPASNAIFGAWRKQQGDELERYARFCALAEHFQSGWRRFPEAYRHPERPEVAAFAADHARRITYHAWVEWLLDGQLARASQSLALVQDLPIGFDVEGADGWSFQDSIAADVAIGAPPDPFNVQGQEWGLSPFIPWKLRAAGYAPFISTLRASFAHAGGLRIDHVMGLFRLFWIPRGAPPAEGTYVKYPSEDMLDLLALEAERAGAFVVGEDLGTVPPGVREELWSRQILSYRLLWFEPAPPQQWPERAMAAVTTHDLPSIAGVWSGADAADQNLRPRLMQQAGIAEDASEAEATRAAYRALAGAPCRVALASLEDLLLVRERPNVPGPSDRPNWCIPLAKPIEDIEGDGLVREVAAILRAR